jgi:glycosyltransferase involved in cell wall biosynthesis
LIKLKEVDFNTLIIGEHTGYGNAARLLMGALEDRGVMVRSGSSVMLNFCMPPKYKYAGYSIGYTPWESTEVPKNWVKGLKQVDQLWTTSSWVKSIFRRYRDDNIVVVPHGVEQCWSPNSHKRASDRPFTFLHVGEPAVRKGGDLVLEAWYKAFRGRKDVHLIYKCIKYPSCRIKNDRGSIVASPESMENVSSITRVLSQPELHQLYNSVDCMVYPTRGEGFGLIPFEAMASGLPTILPSQGGTSDFAGYSELTLDHSMWIASTAERIHPGLWLDHDVDEIIEKMHKAIDQYDTISANAFSAAKDIHTHFGWDMIGERLENLLIDLL